MGGLLDVLFVQMTADGLTLKKGLIVIILAYKAEVLEERRKLNSKFYIMRIGYKIDPQ